MIKYSISVPQEPLVGRYQRVHVGNMTVNTASRILTINPKVLISVLKTLSHDFESSCAAGHKTLWHLATL